jgi:hypothetical protein
MMEVHSACFCIVDLVAADGHAVQFVAGARFRLAEAEAPAFDADLAQEARLIACRIGRWTAATY